MARVTPDGTHLLFQTSAQIGSYNNNNHVEIYLYDATANGGVGSLTRVSCRPDGTPAQGDASLIDQTAALTSTFFTPRNINRQRQRGVLRHHRSPVPQDINGQSDGYEWENGTLRLICSARPVREAPTWTTAQTAATSSSALATHCCRRTPTAACMTCTTRGRRRLPDTGYAAAAPSATCQGPPSTQPSVPMAASVSFFGPGDVPSKAVVKKVAISARRTVTGSRFLPSVLVPGKGRITVSGAGLKTAEEVGRPRPGGQADDFPRCARSTARSRNRHRCKLKSRGSSPQAGYGQLLDGDVLRDGEGVGGDDAQGDDHDHAHGHHRHAEGHPDACAAGVGVLSLAPQRATGTRAGDVAHARRGRSAPASLPTNFAPGDTFSSEGYHYGITVSQHRRRPDGRQRDHGNGHAARGPDARRGRCDRYRYQSNAVTCTSSGQTVTCTDADATALTTGQQVLISGPRRRRGESRRRASPTV